MHANLSKKSKLKAIFKLFILLFALTTTARAEKSPKYEVRAVWLTTIGGIDWPHSYSAEAQKQELGHILDQLKAANVNTILVQARVRGTTIYPSAMEPWDGCITGTPGRSPGYDPLQLVIDESHRRGMECHAWIVTIPVGKWNKIGCQQLRRKYPKLIKKIGDEGYMDPENVLTADYLARICTEVTRRYDVDGIHLDYIRYPEKWRLKVSRQQGREHITRIVRTIHQAVKQEKPWVKLSCSPIGKHDDLVRYSSHGWNARTTVCQDAQAWMRDGLMDMLFPMMYFQGNNFFPFALDWQEHSYGRIVVPGLGIYMLHPHEKNWPLEVVEREMQVTRQYGLGHCYFRSKFLTDNVKGVYDFACRFDCDPSLVPPMTWACTTPPSAPKALQLKGNRLSWQAADDFSGGDYLLYNIYASRTFPVDISDPANLVATRLRATSATVMPSGYYYAVTAQNRYGLEGPAATFGDAPNTHSEVKKSAMKLYRTALVPLPKKPVTLDAEYLIIENLHGQQMGVFPWRGRHLNLSALPDGIYRFRSLGRKGRTHIVGTFALRKSKKLH